MRYPHDSTRRVRARAQTKVDPWSIVALLHAPAEPVSVDECGRLMLYQWPLDGVAGRCPGADQVGDGRRCAQVTWVIPGSTMEGYGRLRG